MDYSEYIKLWVGVGALSGSIISGVTKMNKIMNEPSTSYKNDVIEPPIRMIYHTCRIASHTGLGAFIGGTTALTAPLSIPMYCWYKSDPKPDC